LDTAIIIAIGLALALGALVVWRIAKGHGEALWISRVSGDLIDLHLNVQRLPSEARSKFFSEAAAVYQATKGKFDRKRFAMRFFGWYATEYPSPDTQSLTIEGAISGAIPIMRDWARSDASLKEAAETEIRKIGTFLYQALERATIPEDQKIEAQLTLLQMMGAKPANQEFPEA
jgi:hypothetical protein